MNEFLRCLYGGAGSEKREKHRESLQKKRRPYTINARWIAHSLARPCAASTTTDCACFDWRAWDSFRKLLRIDFCARKGTQKTDGKAGRRVASFCCFCFREKEYTLRHGWVVKQAIERETYMRSAKKSAPTGKQSMCCGKKCLCVNGKCGRF